MNLSPVLKQRFFDTNGLPLAGGKLYSYVAGTSTPQATYTDSGGLTANANPVILDASGEANVWLDPSLSYKFILHNALNALQFSVDNVIGSLTANSVATSSIQDGAVTLVKLAPQVFGPYSNLNYSLSASVGSNALTIALKDGTGADPSVSSPVYISMRNSTAATGTNVIRTVTSALSITVSSGSTLGSTSGAANRVYVYALDNSGAVELAVSATPWDETSLQTTTAEGGAGAADSAAVLYSTTARTSVPIRFLGTVVSTQATAGTWATAPSNVSIVAPPAARGDVVYSAEINDFIFSTTPVTVANSTLTITTGGRPVMVMLQPSDDTIVESYVGGAANPLSPDRTLYVDIAIQRASADIARISLRGWVDSAGGINLTTWAPSSVSCVDAAPAGTHTYRLQAFTGDGGPNTEIFLSLVKLVAYEL